MEAVSFPSRGGKICKWLFSPIKKVSEAAELDSSSGMVLGERMNLWKTVRAKIATLEC